MIAGWVQKRPIMAGFCTELVIMAVGRLVMSGGALAALLATAVLTKVRFRSPAAESS